MYDFAHGQSDYFEGVTHSLCTLEFEVHRPLYNYFVDLLEKEKGDGYRPRQIEFNRLNLTYTVMSKRKLLQLVQEGRVNGWDDPRMPTLCGLRRRGYTPESIRSFIQKIGYTKFDGTVDMALLESAVREDLNLRAPRISAVLDPVRLILTNYPEGQVEMMEAVNNPEDPTAGTHPIAFSRELYIERDDFLEEAPKKFYRMTPGQEVRLKSAYIVRCTGCKKDETGRIEEIYAEYLPDTLSGRSDSNRKVKGTLHWVSVQHSLPAEVRLYDRLFTVENPMEDKDRDFTELLNPGSLTTLHSCRVEAELQKARPLDHFQFQRIGYFNLDPDSRPGHLVFNRTVPLKDSWSKIKDKT
jgi:glutaminyl-tRNA synthetase